MCLPIQRSQRLGRGGEPLTGGESLAAVGIKAHTHTCVRGRESPHTLINYSISTTRVDKKREEEREGEKGGEVESKRKSIEANMLINYLLYPLPIIMPRRESDRSMSKRLQEILIDCSQL